MSEAFKMVDVGAKEITRRCAVAQGEIFLSPQTIAAIEQKQLPKGDVLAMAQVAAINGAKKTPDIMPLCHPLPLDAIQAKCELKQDSVQVSCEVRCTGRTGVEMEAMSGVSAALLCIYDLTKSIDRGAVISQIRLMRKEGGKSGIWERERQDNQSQLPQTNFPRHTPRLNGLRAGVITASDRCSRAEAVDVSGAKLREYLEGAGAESIATAVIADEEKQLAEKVKEYCLEQELDLVLLCGGTGLGPRDVTPEALAPLWTKRLPGFGELFRSRGFQKTPRAILSRCEAGLIGKTLVFLLPGSSGAVSDTIALFDEVLEHALAMVSGGGH